MHALAECVSRLGFEFTIGRLCPVRHAHRRRHYPLQPLHPSPQHRPHTLLAAFISDAPLAFYIVKWIAVDTTGLGTQVPRMLIDRTPPIRPPRASHFSIDGPAVIVAAGRAADAAQRRAVPPLPERLYRRVLAAGGAAALRPLKSPLKAHACKPTSSVS